MTDIPPEVNEGALSFCKIFLGSGADQPLEHIVTLCSALEVFLEYIRVGLSHNKMMITTEHDKQFHFEMEGGFRQLESEIGNYIQLQRVDADAPDTTPSMGASSHNASDDEADPTAPPKKPTGDSRNRSISMAEGVPSSPATERITPTRSVENFLPSERGTPKRQRHGNTQIGRAHV